MSNEQIALLRALAQRPSQSPAASVLPIFRDLVQAGYVAYGPSGWMTTAAGCGVIERSRPPAR